MVKRIQAVLASLLRAISISTAEHIMISGVIEATLLFSGQPIGFPAALSAMPLESAKAVPEWIKEFAAV